jgi:hypothetical protein
MTRVEVFLPGGRRLTLSLRGLELFKSITSAKAGAR